MSTDTIAWSKPSIYSEGTGVHHGYSTAKADLAEYARIVGDGGVPRLVNTAWFAKLDPGGFIIPHVDQGPWLERWHYPISGEGWVWQDWPRDAQYKTYGHMSNYAALLPGIPYRMNHHKPHAVWNPYDEPRIILIVEYDNPVDQPTTDLILCDMIPEIQTMIDTI